MDDFERFYIGENPIYSLQQCKDSFEDLGLTRVSSSNRYSENLNPPMTEKTIKKPGEDGQYYFSTDLGATNHSIKVKGLQNLFVMKDVRTVGLIVKVNFIQILL